MDSRRARCASELPHDKVLNALSSSDSRPRSCNFVHLPSHSATASPNDKLSISNEELSVFTNIVIGLENAGVRQPARTCRSDTVQELAAESSSGSALTENPNSQQQASVPGKGVEQIMIQTVYYTIREDKTEEDALLDPETRPDGGPTVDRRWTDDALIRHHSNTAQVRTAKSHGPLSETDSTDSDRINKSLYYLSTQNICDNESVNLPWITSARQFQEKIDQDGTVFPGSGPQKSTAGRYEDRVSLPSWNQNGVVNCTAKNGVLNDHETTPFRSKKLSKELGKDGATITFEKVQDTIQRVVDTEMKRQEKNAGEIVEAQMLVRVAHNILAKAKNSKAKENLDSTENSQAENRTEGERSSDNPSRPNNAMALELSTSSPAPSSTATNSHQVRSMEPQGCSNQKFRNHCNTEARKRSGGHFSEVYEDRVGKKCAKQGNTLGFTVNEAGEKASSYSRGELDYTQAGRVSCIQQISSPHPGRIKVDCAVVASNSLWPSRVDKNPQQEEIRTRRITKIRKESNSAQSFKEREGATVITTTGESTSSTEAVFHIHQAKLNETEFTLAQNLSETSAVLDLHRDDCHGNEIGKPDFSCHSRVAQQTRCCDSPVSEEPGGNLPDGIVPYSPPAATAAESALHTIDFYSSGQGIYKLPAQSFKQEQIIRQDKQAALRVYAALFTPVTFSKFYASSQKEHSFVVSQTRQGLTPCYETSARRVSNGNATQLSSCSHTQEQEICTNTARNSLGKEPSEYLRARKDGGDRVRVLYVSLLQTQDKSTGRTSETARGGSNENNANVARDETRGLVSEVAEDLPWCSTAAKRTYECTDPGGKQTYVKKACLTSRHKLHDEKKPFICPWIQCNWRFARNDELARHWQSHTGERPHNCPVCQKTFAHIDKWNCHMRDVHNVST